MPSLTLLESFMATARTGSFAEAARQLGVSSSAIGKSVQRLEEELGVTLFQRTTRQVSLTEDGRLLLAGVSPALEALGETVETLRDRTGRIEGPLTVSVPLAGHHMLDQAFSDFLRKTPGVTLEIRYEDQMVDLISKGVDLGIRNGPLRDSTLKQRPFRPYHHRLYASPDYLTQHGSPSLATLPDHSRIALRLSTSGVVQPWLRRDGRPLALPAPRLIVNAIDSARNAARLGLGIAWLPGFVVQEDLAQGRLIQILDDEMGEDGMFYLVWPASRALPRRLRALIDHLVA